MWTCNPGENTREEFTKVCGRRGEGKEGKRGEKRARCRETMQCRSRQKWSHKMLYSAARVKRESLQV